LRSFRRSAGLHRRSCGRVTAVFGLSLANATRCPVWTISSGAGTAKSGVWPFRRRDDGVGLGSRAILPARRRGIAPRTHRPVPSDTGAEAVQLARGATPVSAVRRAAPTGLLPRAHGREVGPLLPSDPAPSSTDHGATRLAGQPFLAPQASPTSRELLAGHEAVTRRSDHLDGYDFKPTFSVRRRRAAPGFFYSAQRRLLPCATTRGSSLNTIVGNLSPARRIRPNVPVVTTPFRPDRGALRRGILYFRRWGGEAWTMCSRSHRRRFLAVRGVPASIRRAPSASKAPHDAQEEP